MVVGKIHEAGSRGWACIAHLFSCSMGQTGHYSMSERRPIQWARIKWGLRSNQSRNADVLSHSPKDLIAKPAVIALGKVWPTDCPEVKHGDTFWKVQALSTCLRQFSETFSSSKLTWNKLNYISSCNSVIFWFKLLTHSIFMLVIHFIIQLLYVSLSLLIFLCNHPRIGTNYFNSSHYNILVHLLFFLNGVMFIQPFFPPSH